jgi:hypothetical protein
LPRPATIVLALVALAAGAVAVAFAWQPGLATFHDDSASYLVMAQAFSPWHAASAPVMAQMPLEKYPPAFPLLLALTGAAFDWHWAHAWVAVAFGASVWLLGVHAARVSASMAVGAAAALAYACMPGAWFNMKGILTEFPYMALSFGTLAWLEARRARALNRGEAAVLALLLAAAMLTRSIGVALWLAIAVAEAARWLRGRDRARARAYAMALAVSAAATALWYVARPSGGDDAYVASGAGVVARARDEGVAWIAALVSGNAASIAGGWLNTLVIYWGEWWQPRFLGPAILGVAALGAVAWRALRFEIDGLYVLAFLAVLLAWPFPGQMYRLALPVYPLALALALCGVAALARRRAPDMRATRIASLAAAIPLAFCVPALFYIADRASLPDHAIMELYRIPFRPDAEAAAARQAGVFRDMARIRDTTPESARVMWYGPAYVALLAQRAGVALDYPADLADMAAQVRRGRPDFVYLSHVHPRDSGQRLGDPLAPAGLLRGRADLVWWRDDGAGRVDAVLFKVDPRRMEEAR